MHTNSPILHSSNERRDTRWQRLRGLPLFLFLMALTLPLDASARELTPADEQTYATVMEHLEAMAGLIESQIDRPDFMLRQLDEYVVVNIAELNSALEKMESIERDLSGESLTTWQERVAGSPELKHFIAAMFLFQERYGDDSARIQRFDSILARIESGE